MSGGGPRRNAAGEWRCSGCQRYLPASVYTVDVRRNEPQGYCPACARANARRWYQRHAADETWFRAHAARTNAHKRARIANANAERRQIARAALTWLAAHGWSGTAIRRETGVTWATQRKIKDGAPVRWRGGIEARLAALVEREFMRERAR